MRADLTAELIFTLAIVLTVVALLLYGLIIKRLLVLVKVRHIWIFPMLSGLLLAALAAVHSYRMFIYFPRLGTAGPADLFELIIGSLQLARLESYLLLAAGIAALCGGLAYYRASSK